MRFKVRMVACVRPRSNRATLPWSVLSLSASCACVGFAVVLARMIAAATGSLLGGRLAVTVRPGAPIGGGLRLARGRTMSIRSRRCAVVDSTDEFCYSTIGAAVPAASAGDTIRVARGKYFEGDIVMGKSFSRSEAPLAADCEAWELLADLNKLLRRT
jgi:hypothetical protein